MNRGIFIFLGAVALIGFAGLYLLQHGQALFVGHPPTERIVFVSTRGGQTDLWTMKTNGSDKRQVTNDMAEDASPSWSPGGTEIISASNREEDRYEIYVSSWNGGYVKRLTSSAGMKDFPDWSRDGKEITFISSGTVHVLARFDGDDLQVMPTVEQGVTRQNPPYTIALWAKTQRSLAVVEDSDVRQTALIREDLEKTDREPIGVTVAGTVTLDWSKSEYRIAAGFIDRRNEEGKSENGILIADVSSVDSEEVFLTSGDTTGPGALRWSPDGRLIAFEMWQVRKHRPDRCVGLYVVPADGGKPRQVAEGETMDPTWSPDGKYIAYTLLRDDGKRDIWRVGADGKGAVNLTGGEGDNFQPEWSPAVRKR